MLLDNDVQVLIDLGFTLYEAKVYLALAKTENATVAAIAKTSKLSRPDVYRTLNKLQQKGFVEKLLNKITQFKIFPIKKVLSILIEDYRHDLLEIQDRASALIYNIENFQLQKSHEDKFKFTMFSQQIARNRELLMLNSTQKTFEAIVSCKDPRNILADGSETIAKALQRGVKIRVLIEKFCEEKSVLGIANRLRKKTNFKIKYLESCEALMSTYDNREALFPVCTDILETGCLTLWTSNPSLLSVFQSYFETKWQKALEF